MATSTTEQATLAAVLSAGLDTASDSSGSIDPFAMPDPATPVFPINGSKATDAQVSFHRDPRGRTVKLQIDRANAPLTGNYVVEIDATTSIYDATGAAPADIDALLQGWRSQLTTDLPNFAYVVMASAQNSSEADTIQITAPVDSGIYATFVVKNATAAPEDAKLELLVEVDSASLRIWTYPGYELTSGDQMLPLDFAQARAPVVAAEIGALTSGGWEQRLDLASRRGCWLQLHTPVISDTVVPILSGPGVYTLTVVATTIVAPQRVP